MRTEHVRQVWVQGAITTIGGILAYWLVTPPAAKSFVYGSSIALVSTLLLAWRMGQGAKPEDRDASRVLRQAYRAAIERFVWVIFLLAVGFRLLKLAPLWMLAGFVAGQAAWLLLPVWMKFENVICQQKR